MAAGILFEDYVVLADRFGLFLLGEGDFCDLDLGGAALLLGCDCGFGGAALARGLFAAVFGYLLRVRGRRRRAACLLVGLQPCLAGRR